MYALAQPNSEWTKSYEYLVLFKIANYNSPLNTPKWRIKTARKSLFVSTTYDNHELNTFRNWLAAYDREKSMVAGCIRQYLEKPY